MYEYKPYAKTGNYLNSQTCFTNTFLKLQTVKKMCVLYAHPPVQLGSLEREKLRTVGIFAISQLVCELYTKEEFLFLTVF